jgi:hypothetical protein
VLDLEAERYISSTWLSESQTIFAETPLATLGMVLLSHCTLFWIFLQGVPVKKTAYFAEPLANGFLPVRSSIRSGVPTSWNVSRKCFSR